MSSYRIKKRDFCTPLGSIGVWLIPLMTYIVQKIAGVKHNQYEWVWWVIIPSFLLLWFFINFRVLKK